MAEEAMSLHSMVLLICGKAAGYVLLQITEEELIIIYMIGSLGKDREDCGIIRRVYVRHL